MRALQLPVPRPVAARAYWPAGRHTGFYRADILLETIANCTTLSAMLQHQAVPATIWHNIGRCIKAFHQQQIYHADLNANNILVDTQQKIHLIDFDRCRITSRQNLLASNLPRLQRSLLKLQTLHQGFQFKSPDWQTLMASYNDNSAA